MLQLVLVSEANFIFFPSALTSPECFFQMVCGNSYTKSPFERGLRAGEVVQLYVFHNERSVMVGKAILCNIGLSDPHELRRTLHNHQLPRTHLDDHVVIRKVEPAPSTQDIRYPYTFTTNDEVPETVSDMSSNGFYIWDTRAMRPFQESQPAQHLSRTGVTPPKPPNEPTICPSKKVSKPTIAPEFSKQLPPCTESSATKSRSQRSFCRLSNRRPCKVAKKKDKQDVTYRTNGRLKDGEHDLRVDCGKSSVREACNSLSTIDESVENIAADPKNINHMQEDVSKNADTTGNNNCHDIDGVVNVNGNNTIQKDGNEKNSNINVFSKKHGDSSNKRNEEMCVIVDAPHFKHNDSYNTKKSRIELWKTNDFDNEGESVKTPDFVSSNYVHRRIKVRFR